MLRAMRFRRLSLSFALLPLLSGCAADPPPPAQPPRPPPPAAPSAEAPALPASPAPASARQLGDETAITTASGATFVAPKGWWLTQSADALVLEDPDRALKTTLLETPEGDALKAIDTGWQKAEPGFALKRLHEPESPPPIRGWDSVTQTDYETKASEHRTAVALARRYNGATYVATTDGDTAAFGRRAAQLATALWTFKPAGMHEESFKGKTPRAIDEARAKELDAFIEQARTRLDVPGAAVAIVEGGKVVYERGFGARALGKQEVVTPSTLFMIGSITKSMTTMMEATLVDAGKLSWDMPVTTALPGFALGDADVTSKLQMWHTACACTGMPRRDLEFIFEFAHVSPEQSVASLKTMKPTTGFGETFQYSNLMVSAGGFAAAHASDPKRSLGDAYDAVMKKNVFDPIGMKATTLDFAVAQREDHAMPNAEGIDGVVHPIPIAEERFVTPLRPAGGVWSNVRDMERYVMTEMAKGVSPDGKRVVSEANLLERRKQRVRASDTGGYGLGLEVGTFRDLPVVEHDGGTFGFGTMMFMLPEQGIAVISLTNTSNGGLFNGAVERKVVEEIFEGAKELAAPRVEFFAKEKRDAVAKALEKLNREPDAEWVKGLAGTYTNDGLGKVTITAGPKRGTFDAGEWKSAFGEKKEDDGTVKAILLDPPLAGLELVVGGDEAHPTLTINDDQVKYVFARAK
jgi:CubicO group peptidase (beta-lactamase class C family)